MREEDEVSRRVEAPDWHGAPVPLCHHSQTQQSAPGTGMRLAPGVRVIGLGTKRTDGDDVHAVGPAMGHAARRNHSEK